MVRSDSGSEKIAGPSRPRARPNAAADKMILEQRLDLRYAPADFPDRIIRHPFLLAPLRVRDAPTPFGFLSGFPISKLDTRVQKIRFDSPPPPPLCERLRVDESLRFDKGPDIRRDWRVFVQASSRI